MQSLSRVKLVHSQRGLNGGFTLTMDTAALSMFDIISAVDPVRRFQECPLGLPTHGDDLCPLHQHLEDAAQMLENKFKTTSIADLLNVPETQKPLCHFPGVGAQTAPEPDAQ
jgi:Rrf2 family protein